MVEDATEVPKEVLTEQRKKELQKTDVEIPQREGLSVDQIEKARGVIEHEAMTESEAKTIAVGEYQQAQANLDKFIGDRKFLMETKVSSEDLKAKINKATENLTAAQSELEKAKQSYEKASAWSFSYKKGLQVKQGKLTKKTFDLRAEIDSMKELADQVSKAENSFRGKNELDLKAAVAVTRTEAEKR